MRSVKAIEEAEEVTRWYVALVVGLTHSRGVNRVMPIEEFLGNPLEGVSILLQRETCEQCHTQRWEIQSLNSPL